MNLLIHKLKKNITYLIPLVILILLYLFNNFSINSPSYNFPPNNMLIHYIDVGQGDCILVQVNNKNLLIDSGPSSSKNKLMKYLKNSNIDKFDYVIATHPHEDHIGNMSTIINSFNIVNFYAPKVYDNSKAFEDMIYSLKNKHLKILPIRRGTDSIDLGNNINPELFIKL
ncbi:MAG TPA: hypothetical protein DG753_13615 [Clostridium sp.]|nr:hypothetical protein [Clostridium sp.]